MNPTSNGPDVFERLLASSKKKARPKSIAANRDQKSYVFASSSSPSYPSFSATKSKNVFLFDQNKKLGKTRAASHEDLADNISPLPTPNLYPSFHVSVKFSLPPCYSLDKMPTLYSPHGVNSSPCDVSSLKAMQRQIISTKKKLKKQEIPKEGVFDLSAYMPPSQPM